MKHKSSTLFLLIACVMLLGATSPKDVKTIHSARKAFNQAIANHDVEAMKAFLAEDYVATISTGEIQRSREAHIKSFTEHFKQFPDVKYIRNPTAIQMSETHPHAFEQGTWVGTMTTDGGPKKVAGEYTAAWKRTDQGWLIYSELFVAFSCHGEGCEG